MQYTQVKRRQREPVRDARVYADLDALVRLQFKAVGFSFLPRQPIHSVLFGRHASRLRGRGLNFEEIRGYLPGDDIRSIDWKVTARTGRPHVRVYTEERDRPVWLVVDQRISMFFGSRVNMKSVTAAEAAALAAWRVLGAGDRVGAMVFDDLDIVEFQPLRNRGQVMRILGAVVEKNHKLSAESDTPPNPGMLNQVLTRLQALVKHDSLICIISDGTGLDDGSQRLITQLNQHNDVLAALIYDPLEAVLPDAGLLVVSDGAAQLELDTARHSLRDRYQRDFESRHGALRKISQKHAMPLFALSTAEPVAEQVRQSLGHRPRARRV